MLTVAFHDTFDDARLKFAVIVARHRGAWVFCKHKARTTYEWPGGRREPGECIEETARRELWEETGALTYRLTAICAYSVSQGDGSEPSFGMLYYAEIETFGELPPMEIESVVMTKTLPNQWTYPDIQPHLLPKVQVAMRESVDATEGAWYTS